MLIINTFDALEPDVLAALRAEYPRIYTVGPLGSLLRRHHDEEDDAGGGSLDLSLWKHDTECLAWMDAQLPGSVVYANFGSLTVVTAAQLAEFAWGLAATDRPFLWVIREDLVAGGPAASSLPPAFAAETAARGRVATWCPQERVLRHRAVGCFLTHSGWNSTLEGIVEGVPMVCWPFFADQQINSRFVAAVWRNGLDMKDVCDRGVVERTVREAMESTKIRRSAHALAEQVKRDVADGGASSLEFKHLVSFIRELSTSAAHTPSPKS